MSRKLLAGTLLLSAAILAGVFSTAPRESLYARTVSEFLAQPTFDRTIVVQGELVRGSLCVHEEPCEFRFRLANRGSSRIDAGAFEPELSVRYPRCVVPEAFGELDHDVLVTVQGRQCANCHQFEASLLSAGVVRAYRVRSKHAASDSTDEPRRVIPRCR